MTIFSFPKGKDQRELWFASLPNVTVDSKGKKICKKHWPENYETVWKKGRERPRYLLSVFDLPASFCRQTLTSPREIKKRKIDYDSRQETQVISCDQLDNINNWEDLVDHCGKLEGLVLSSSNESLQLHEIIGIPPNLIFSIVIYHDFKDVCFHSGSKIAVRDIVGGFSAKLEKYSELVNIISRLKNHNPNINNVMNSYSCRLQEFASTTIDNDKDIHRIQFLAEQLKSQIPNSCGNRYGNSPTLLRTALNLYFRSRNCYNELRKTVTLPHSRTIQSRFGKFGTPGSIKECTQTVNTVLFTAARQSIIL